MSKGLRWVVTVQVAAALLCFAVESFCKLALHLNGVYSWPLLGDHTFFIDFTLLIGRFSLVHTKAFFLAQGYPFMYPPGAGAVYAAFFPLGSSDLRVWIFSSSLLVVFAIALILFVHALTRKGLTRLQAAILFFILLAFAYPFWFCYQRGNVEIYVWAFSALGAWALYRRHDSAAAACFAVAGTMKLYPAIYLGILLSLRKWKALLFGVIVFALAGTLFLWILSPHVGFAARQTLIGLHQFSLLYAGIDPLALSFDHSLFGVYKYAVRQHPTHLFRHSMQYTAMVGLIGIALYLFRIRKLSTSRQIVALTCALLVLPPVSFDYTLLHVYTALGFLLFTLWGKESRTDLLLLTLLALVASPITEVIWKGYTLEGQIKAALLVLAFLVSTFADDPNAGFEVSLA